MDIKEVQHIAADCSMTGMCKINFLKTGICPPGKKYRYLSHYPQGRMEIANALADGAIPITEGVVHSAETCILCPVCDTQCHFIKEIRSIDVMKALKGHVADHLSRNEPVVKPENDEVVSKLREAVGEQWATNDIGILVAYSRDNNSHGERRFPKYVALPHTTEEVAKIVGVAREFGLPYTPRGNGSNAHGRALGDGIIIDSNRMKKIEINPELWCATVECGVTSFELQTKASKHGMRANVAEPMACVCANIMMTRMNTLFCHAYGMGLDHLIDAEFVSPDGKIFTLNDKEAPDLLNYTAPDLRNLKKEMGRPPIICTKATVKLFPKLDDEEGILIPHSSFRSASLMSRDLAQRRIGFAAAVVSADFLIRLFAPRSSQIPELLDVFQNRLQAHYFVLVIGDKYAIESVKKLSTSYIDNRMYRILTLGVPKLIGDEGIMLLSQIAGNKKPYELLFNDEMLPMMEAALSPSIDSITDLWDDDLKDHYAKLYSRPEMTDLAWQNMFRIMSVRMVREKHFMGFIVYFLLEQSDIIEDLCKDLKTIGDKYGLQNYFAYHNTYDYGKWGLLEYDYYFDHTSREEREKTQQAKDEAARLVIEYTNTRSRYIAPAAMQLGQGACRNESFLYRDHSIKLPSS